MDDYFKKLQEQMLQSQELSKGKTPAVSKSEAQIEQETPSEVSGDQNEEKPSIKASFDHDIKKDLIPVQQPKFFLSQSLIKEVTDHRGDYKDVCPKQIYEKYITKQFRSVTTPMLDGIFGESIMLGKGAGGQVVTDLPRHKKKGTKLTAQLNIEEQAIRFPLWCAERGINIIPDVNTQVPIIKRFSDKVLFRTELDIFPTPFIDDDGKIHLAVIDLKMTGNVNNTMGQYSWGSPEYMDHLQADSVYWILQDFDMELNIKYNPEKEDVYRHIFGNKAIAKIIKNEDLRFYYFVVGYRGESLENQVKFVYRSYREPNGSLLRQKEFQERARKTLSQLSEWRAQSWPAKEANYCDKCPVSELNGGYCQEYRKIKTI